MFGWHVIDFSSVVRVDPFALSELFVTTSPKFKENVTASVKFAGVGAVRTICGKRLSFDANSIPTCPCHEKSVRFELEKFATERHP